jgi:hydroxymethylglutaryl-CoA reductase (NADPH)
MSPRSPSDPPRTDSLGPADGLAPDALAAALRPKDAAERPLPRRVPGTTDATRAALDERRARLADEGIALEALAGRGAEIEPERLAGSIEGFVGFARVPVGVFGPLRLNGSFAQGDFFVPLATSEGTLVASYQHAANVVNRSGGISALCAREGVGRTPSFHFANLAEAEQFRQWLRGRADALAEVVAGGSRFCRLRALETTLLGNVVFVLVDFATGDAAGQNMVTAATQALCARLLEEMPVQPVQWQIEGNLSGDKKASVRSFHGARGKNVSAEVVLTEKQAKRYYDATPRNLVRAWSCAAWGAAQAGSIGIQANYANALAALFIACGQDVACVSEAVTGITRCELDDRGDVYLSVTMPNLIVGTVGGGTYLPTARECLAMLGCEGAGHARKLAEICAAVALCGELAIIGAMASGSFASAHAAASERKKRGSDAD